MLNRFKHVKQGYMLNRVQHDIDGIYDLTYLTGLNMLNRVKCVKHG